jgi:endonuclease-3
MPNAPVGSPVKTAAPVAEVLRRLSETYPEAHCSLVNESPLQLLIATILSAQCTDARVNMVTPPLFRRFPDAESLASAPEEELEELIRSTGFYKSKARSIRGAARAIVRDHAGEVPRTMEQLLELPGVGRKTANVVLGNAFGTPDGVVVDTHVGRLSRRLGWTRQTDPEKVESDLGSKVPKSDWVFVAHALIEHGRARCMARNPRCDACTLNDICPRRGVKAKEGTRSARVARRGLG